MGGAEESVDGDQVFASIIDAADPNPFSFDPWVESGPQTLSALSDSFVRRFPFTVLGREWLYPYVKRINCTLEALSDEFVDRFVDLIDRVVRGYSSDVKLVFQMLMGGGAYQNSSKRANASIPHRDYTYCFIFDLFYLPGKKHIAERLQDEMQMLIEQHYNYGQEARVFWGTFGAVSYTHLTLPTIYSV